MNTIVIGVDGSERSEDAIALGGRIAAASGAQVIVACSFPATVRGYAALRDAALDTAHAMSRKLEGVPAQRVSIRAPAGSPAQGLQDLASAERAWLIVVGSTHTGRLGRVHPGSTGEKLLHGAPCAVAIVPRAYDVPRVGRIGVAYDGSDEAQAALAAAVALAEALGAELELVGVALARLEDIEQETREQLERAAAGLDFPVTTVLRTGDPGDELTFRSAALDLLVTGSRGYGPLRSVLTGGVSGRLTRSALCPVIVFPRGAELALQVAA